MREHQGDYGYDGSFHTISAGAQVAGVGVSSAALFAGAGVALARRNRLAAAIAAASAVEILGTAASYIYATRSGKFWVWASILDELGLRGDETLLDLGCGRGAVLLAAAKRLPKGRAIGVDLWRADQTDNSQQATLINASLENVADRIELHTADMTALPLPDRSVDVIVSNLAIHNIPERAGRRVALDEAVRVLRPGGRLAIADLWETRQHAERLRGLGWQQVRRRNLGWRMWYGGPWFATRLVTATKPG
ncbi:methyltransferase small domain-containing protein [Mycobacterium rhizamassiliense]|jgi:SAM-dependent methyltransferase|uniref:Methyltransferase small domain-containing protein n=1 Tax=Mycobacterium rhizamassiliense TaxID=1841860 RepID=A0A2U3NNC9_9MYCO|nr:class I SAM-dependent methyltransferase [Mycobacterium rhizamassiliense]SPM32933.1 methyltransferase small domain-containing protein [Mycobacterium rhizamassiliense]